MLGLEAIEEYNNAGALLGLDGLEGEEFLGKLKKMPPIQRARTVAKVTAPPPRSRGSRAEMEKHFNEVPAHIKAGLKQGVLRLADICVYSIKQMDGNIIKLWQSKDIREVGITNLSNGKLPKNQCLLMSGITILACTAAGAAKSDMMAAEMKSLDAFPALANGEFSLKANNKQLVPETSMYLFRTGNLHNVAIGYYKLHNPRLIADDVPIEATIEVGNPGAIANNTWIFCGLHGTITTP